MARWTDEDEKEEEGGSLTLSSLRPGQKHRMITTKKRKENRSWVLRKHQKYGILDNDKRKHTHSMREGTGRAKGKLVL